MNKEITFHTKCLPTRWALELDLCSDIFTASSAVYRRTLQVFRGSRSVTSALNLLEVRYGEYVMVRPRNMRRGIQLQCATTALSGDVSGLGVTPRANIERRRNTRRLTVEAEGGLLLKDPPWKPHVHKLRSCGA